MSNFISQNSRPEDFQPQAHRIIRESQDSMGWLALVFFGIAILINICANGGIAIFFVNSMLFGIITVFLQSWHHQLIARNLPLSLSAITSRLGSRISLCLFALFFLIGLAHIL